MIFPYWKEDRGDEVRLLPLIPVTLLARRGQSIHSFALVDSGAEHNVFPLEAAEELGLDLSNMSSVTIVGAGGHETPGKATQIDYEIGRYRWFAPIIFSPAVSERPLLGQAGFFAFFTVTFRHTREDIEIKQSQSRRTAYWHA